MIGEMIAKLTAEEAKAQVNVPVTEAKRLLDGGEVTMIDVREPDEWRAGHVPGARHIPLGQLEARLAEVPRDRAVLLFCRSGNRSGKATAALRAVGFDQVTNVAGGILAWQEHKLPLESDATPND